MKRLASSRYALSFCVITLVLTGCGGAQVGSQRSSSALLSSAGGSASQYLSHVIVIIQENRSFENFFAGYPGANAPVSGCAVPAPGQRATPAGRRGVGGERSKTAYGRPPHDVMVPLRPVTFETNSDLNHNWHSSIIDWHHGGMDGFSKRKDGKSRGYPAYEYVEHSQIAPYWTMAEQYVLADAMFPTEFGGSFTAHLTLVAGTDDIELPGQAEVDFPNAAPDDCDSPPGTTSSYLTHESQRALLQGAVPVLRSVQHDGAGARQRRHFVEDLREQNRRRRILGAVRSDQVRPLRHRLVQRTSSLRRRPEFYSTPGTVIWHRSTG